MSQPGAGSLDLVVPETVLIPAGRLEIRGADDAARSLEIASFRLGCTPVTNLEYASFVASGRGAVAPWSGDPEFCKPRQPVVGVTWDEATAYCTWLSEMSGQRWRLPTENEWEFAACGGLTSPRTAWGEEIPPGEIPEGAMSGPWEVSLGTPNGYGLFDMGTIVHEWCANWHEADRPASSPRRASRGGSWRHKIRWSSPSAKSSLPPQYRYSDYGFRVLQELER